MIITDILLHIDDIYVYLYVKRLQQELSHTVTLVWCAFLALK